jgi:putative MATE family efflux protein
VEGLDSRTLRITQGSILAALLRIAGPVVVSTTLQASYQVINTFWVGRLGASPVAAVALSAPLTFFLLVLGGGLSVAGSIFVAQYSGARQHAMVNHAAGQTLVMVVLVSVLLSIAGSLSAAPVLGVSGVAPDVLRLGASYLRITYAGLVFSYLFMTFQAILQGAGEVRFPLRVVAASVVVNACLDPLLIFGWGPVRGFGVAGAAAATVAAQAFAAIIGVRSLFTGRFGLHLHRRDFVPDSRFIRRALALGLPASVEQSTRVLATILLTWLAARFGTVSLAGYGIASRVLALFLIPTIAFSTATATVVGQNIGAGRFERAERAARVAALTAFVALTALGLAFRPLAAATAHLLVPGDPRVVEEGAGFLRVVAPAFGVIGAQFALAGAFRGAGRTLLSMSLSLGMQWLCQLPVSYWLALHTSLGFAGIWWGFPIANSVMLVVTIVCLKSIDWTGRPLTQPAATPRECESR